MHDVAGACIMRQVHTWISSVMADLPSVRMAGASCVIVPVVAVTSATNADQLLL